LISYRHADTKYAAIAFEEALKRRLSEDCVFRDEAARKGGDKLASVLDRAASTCKLMLVLIGPKWAEATTPSGAARLIDEQDPMRKETRLALNSGAVVLPIHLDGAIPLSRKDLPDDISAIAELWPERVEQWSLTHDIHRIIGDVVRRTHPGGRRTSFSRADPEPWSIDHDGRGLRRREVITTQRRVKCDKGLRAMLTPFH
jgi:hypothetical protein